MKIKKGDIVGRKSYGKDILFIVDRIIKMKGSYLAILKGITIRIEADAFIDDLEIIDKNTINNKIKLADNEVLQRINKYKQIESRVIVSNIYTGKILHLDGDRKYSQKSANYYQKIGLNAIVKNIPENKQALLIKSLLNRYNPDILIITGHDAMIRNGTNYHDIYNYRNSRHFVNTVKEARKWAASSDKLVIFAGACQSFFEALISSGADFASSPGRILIDFIDPLIVAEKIALAENYRFVSINEIVTEIREGAKGVGGIGARGKSRRIRK